MIVWSSSICLVFSGKLTLSHALFSITLPRFLFHDTADRRNIPFPASPRRLVLFIHQSGDFGLTE
jgi:hypothetical protein